jgi:hypothetical protein
MCDRTITFLERNNVVIQPYTNNRAAYEAFVKQVKIGYSGWIPSYATVNRAVQEAGDSIDLPSALGVFSIRKVLLLRKSI